MNTNFGIELADESAQDISGGYNFGQSSYTTIGEKLYIDKALVSQVYVFGKFAGAEGDAVALGDNTSTQAITATYTGPLGSQSSSTTTSATGYPYYKYDYKPY